MPNNKFDAKSFNPEAFRYKVGQMLHTRLNELRKSKVLAPNPDIREVFSAPDGAGYARIAMRGLLDGDAVNYDGQTDITATTTKTFEQGVVVVGRAKAWVEKDFSYDLTGEDFMDGVAAQVAEYWQDVDQDTLLAVLEGIFSMTSTQGARFAEKHTYAVDGPMEATSLNSAVSAACGDRKKKFSMIFMHSTVSTNLENLNLLTALKYTDREGVTRDLTLYTWNGKLVAVDDGMPAEAGYFDSTEDEDGALKIVANSATPAQDEIKLSDVTPYFGGKTLAAGDYVVRDTRYTSYVLGEGSIEFEDIGARVPFEMARDPKTDGGQDTLYTRQRKVFAPRGISYEKKSQASLSPTDAELANGENWDVVHSGEVQEAERSYVSDKTIAICRLLSRG